MSEAKWWPPLVFLCSSVFIDRNGSLCSYPRTSTSFFTVFSLFCDVSDCILKLIFFALTEGPSQLNSLRLSKMQLAIKSSAPGQVAKRTQVQLLLRSVCCIGSILREIIDGSQLWNSVLCQNVSLEPNLQGISSPILQNFVDLPTNPSVLSLPW